MKTLEVPPQSAPPSRRPVETGEVPFTTSMWLSVALHGAGVVVALLGAWLLGEPPRFDEKPAVQIVSLVDMPGGGGEAGEQHEGPGPSSFAKGGGAESDAVEAVPALPSSKPAPPAPKMATEKAAPPSPKPVIEKPAPGAPKPEAAKPLVPAPVKPPVVAEKPVRVAPPAEEEKPVPVAPKAPPAKPVPLAPPRVAEPPTPVVPKTADVMKVPPREVTPAPPVAKAPPMAPPPPAEKTAETTAQQALAKLREQQAAEDNQGMAKARQQAQAVAKRLEQQEAQEEQAEEQTASQAMKALRSRVGSGTASGGGGTGAGGDGRGAGAGGAGAAGTGGGGGSSPGRGSGSGGGAGTGTGLGIGLAGVRLRAYQERIRERVTDAWSVPLPREAAQKLQAIASLRIDRSGGVSGLSIVNSSGNPVFDDSLLRAIRQSSPMPPLPDDFTGPSLQVTMRFRPHG